VAASASAQANNLRSVLVFGSSWIDWLARGLGKSAEEEAAAAATWIAPRFGGGPGALPRA